MRAPLHYRKMEGYSACGLNVAKDTSAHIAAAVTYQAGAKMPPCCAIQVRMAGAKPPNMVVAVL